jgi:hypothetical protein
MSHEVRMKRVESQPLAVVRRRASGGELRPSVAAVTRIGGYDGLQGAHQAIHAWCRLHGHALAGPSWEIYGHMCDPQSLPRTEVFYLLKAR